MKKNRLSLNEKKLFRLPLHHIDTSVILEPKNSENGVYCAKYLNLVGYKYRGVFSLPVLGELFYKILNLKDLKEKYDMLDVIQGIITEKKIGICFVKGTEDIVKLIKEIQPNITPTDRLIVASAIAYGANTLVTLDTKLIRNDKLERKFKIQISHPRELI